MRLPFIVICLLGLGSCQRKELHVDLGPSGSNAQPLADAGTGGTYPIRTTITLDASASRDPDGTIGSYQWRVATRPPRSVALIEANTAELASFVLDEPGAYVFELTVTDDAGASATTTVTFRAVAPRVVSASAGLDQTVAWRATVQLAGSVDAEQDANVIVAWELIARPSGSAAALAMPTTLTPSFAADREGAYTLRFTASTPYQSVSDDVMVTAVVDRQLLEYVLVDAEYSLELDSYVIVSATPPRLRIHDPVTGTEEVVTLSESPLAVSLAPDGMQAAVAHNNAVTVIDLQDLQPRGTFPVSINVHDVVFGADDRVHCFHRGINHQPIKTIDLTSGNVSDSTGPQVGGSVNARLHPGTLVAYGATTLVSPEDLERYDVAAAPVAYSREMPYHGLYALGGNLWFTQDGALIVTRSGNIFHSSDNATFDMTYAGTLGLGDHNWVTHSQATGKLAAIRTEYDAWFNPFEFYLRVYDQQFTLLESVMLPDTPYNSTTYSSAGRFVAFSADSSSLYVIARAGPDPGFVHALYRFDP